MKCPILQCHKTAVGAPLKHCKIHQLSSEVLMIVVIGKKYLSMSTP
jgi:hypothetical protein